MNPTDRYLSFEKFGNEMKEKSKTIINTVRKRKDKTLYQDGSVWVCFRVEEPMKEVDLAGEGYK